LTADAENLDDRVLVLAPTDRDARITARLLGDGGLQVAILKTMKELIAELRRGAGVLVVTDHPSQSTADNLALRSQLMIQAHWSEMPVIALSRHDSGSERAQLLGSLPGAVVLERPVLSRTLVSAVLAGLRARTRQYEVRDQFDQIHRANQELSHAGRAKDAFLATLAHELRNPLSAMTSAAQLLDAEAQKAGTRRMAKQIITRQIGQMTRLLDDLLDISRITHNRLELRKEMTSLSHIVEGAVETVQHLVLAKRHRLNVHPSVEDVQLFVDPLRISQVLANLLVNAAKYTPSGGQIDLCADREGDNLVAKVIDTGIGIPSEALDGIFGMFAQLKPALERSEGGLGIGLALARGLVELHGGTISAQSAGAGLGSAFTIRLPIEAGELAAKPRSDSHQVSPRHIVLADDNADSLSALARVLEMQGHQVSVAADGLAVLQLLAQTQPQIALLDIGMPGMNGYEVAARVRTDFADKKIMLVALSGWGQAEDKRRALAAGFHHHLTKPVDFDKLAEILEATGI
jgi:signal transduction histidine kinase